MSKMAVTGNNLVWAVCNPYLRYGINYRQGARPGSARALGSSLGNRPMGIIHYTTKIDFIALWESGYPPIRNNQLWSVRSQCILVVES